jgi:hypothetical protein
MTPGAMVGGGFSLTSTQGTQTSVDIRKSKEFTKIALGPGRDGIDHDFDRIYLWLTPQLTATLCGNDFTIGISQKAEAGPSAQLIHPVYVGSLKGTLSMDPDTKAKLEGAGITPAEYPAILARDPFASSSGTAVDPVRFDLLDTTLPYMPSPVPGASMDGGQVVLNNSEVKLDARAAEDAYNVTLTAGAGGGFAGFGAFLTATTSWTWTSTTVKTTSTGDEQEATAYVFGPSSTYSGPTDIEVYWDRIYDSFLFKFVEPGVQPTLVGVVTRGGQPQPYQPLSLRIGDRTYRTLTNSKGEYRLFRVPAGTGQFTVFGTSRSVTVGSTVEQKINIQ